MYSGADTSLKIPVNLSCRRINNGSSELTGIGGGFPHSDMLGSKFVRNSPSLFAAYHVLHRLCMPRHPPNALKTLDRSHCLYSCLFISDERRRMGCRSAPAPFELARVIEQLNTCRTCLPSHCGSGLEVRTRKTGLFCSYPFDDRRRCRL